VDLVTKEGRYQRDRRILVVRQGRFLIYHGVGPVKFPFSLKELEFEPDHRDADLSDHLVETPGDYLRVAVPD
jgi:hypothetical protein